MSKIAVVTDSNSGITQDEARKMGIVVIPMPFTIDGEEYLEDISISQEEFYDKLNINTEVMTSQPSQNYLEELFSTLLNYYEDIVYIPMSSGLSATCENATKYAEKFSGHVQVVDNRRISVTQRESVMEALSMVESGKSAEEIKTHLENTGEKNSIYIMLDTLKYLKKGGRISSASAILGDMFKLKPILFSNGGAFEKFAVAFTIEQGKRKIIQKLKQEIESKFAEDMEKGRLVISLAHTNSKDKIEKVREEIQKSFPNVPLHFVDPLSLSVACHIGSGAIAVALSVNYYI